MLRDSLGCQLHVAQGVPETIHLAAVQRVGSGNSNATSGTQPVRDALAVASHAEATRPESSSSTAICKGLLLRTMDQKTIHSRIDAGCSSQVVLPSCHKAGVMTDHSIESERARMSDEMQNLAPQDDIDNLLEELDLKSDSSASGFTKGPFGVIRMYLGGSSESESIITSCPSPTDLLEGTAEEAATPDIQTPASFLNAGTGEGILPIDDANNLESMLQKPFMESDTADIHVTISAPLEIYEIQATDAASTQFLLDHYRFQTDKLFSPLRTRKPPWAILHYPSALSAFSELTLFSKTSHARSALLHSVLAVSAFNWDKINTASNYSDFWWSMGDKLRQNAKKELQLTCSSELSGDKRAKYKEILMAMLNMVTISVSLSEILFVYVCLYLLNLGCYRSTRGS